MKLEELFKRLSFGPFSNISIGNSGAGTILDAKQPTIVDALNNALVRLHSRFVLAEGEVIVEQREETTLYTISSANAISNLDTDPTNPAYIIDSEAKPYKDDLLRILSVWNDQGEPLALNEENNEDSLFTPQPNVLQVPIPVNGSPIHVIYQSKQKSLPLTTPVDLNLTFEVPLVLEEALINYIAYLVYNGMQGQEHKAIAANYLTMYDNLCMEVIELDLVGSSITVSNEKLEARGFV